MRKLQIFGLLIFTLFTRLSSGSENKQIVTPLKLSSGSGVISWVVASGEVSYIIIADYAEGTLPGLMLDLDESKMIVSTGFSGQERRIFVDVKQPLLELLSSDGTWRSIHIKKLSEKQLDEWLKDLRSGSIKFSQIFDLVNDGKMNHVEKEPLKLDSKANQ